MELTLGRVRSSDQGTEGLLTGDGFACHTMEPPWRDNRANISCIPVGSYRCQLRRSGRFGLTLWVREVPGRSFILIHAGNFGGDTALGLRSSTAGCILPGLAAGTIDGQRAVLNSRLALRRLMGHLAGLGEQEFILNIREAS